jgi:hypothetical protein
MFLENKALPLRRVDNLAARLSIPVVPNLWYAYSWGYVKVILVMAENTKKIRS